MESRDFPGGPVDKTLVLSVQGARVWPHVPQLKTLRAATKTQYSWVNKYLRNGIQASLRWLWLLSGRASWGRGRYHVISIASARATISGIGRQKHYLYEIIFDIEMMFINWHEGPLKRDNIVILCHFWGLFLKQFEENEQWAFSKNLLDSSAGMAAGKTESLRSS